MKILNKSHSLKLLKENLVKINRVHLNNISSVRKAFVGVGL